MIKNLNVSDKDKKKIAKLIQEGLTPEEAVNSVLRPPKKKPLKPKKPRKQKV